MSRRIGFAVACLGLFLFTTSLSLAQPCILVNGECPPGRIRNPTAGLEQFQDIAYSTAQDLYMVVYKAGSPRGLTLLPDGTVGPEVVFGPSLVVQDVNIEYNPDRNEFLVVWRYDQPLDVWGRYLDGNGNPLGSSFFIGNGGIEPRIAYSPVSQRYVIVFSGIGLGTHYAIVDGDSTAVSPLILGKTTIDATAFSARIAYSSVSNKFMIVYVRDFSPPTRADVWGRTLGGNGTGFSGAFGIGAGFENQQLPEIGYASTTDQFMVAYEDWSVGGFPDVRFNLVSSAGSVGSRLNLTPGDPNWNQPGPIGFDELNGEFQATYFDGLVSGFSRQVKAGSGTLDSLVLFGALNSVPLGVAIRPDPAEPQAAIVWRNFLGGDGVHVSFYSLDLPPPTITATVLPGAGLQVAYSQAVPVSGGAPPLTFSRVSGTVPPGLSDPDPGTGVISGMATTIGDFVFRVRVEDDQGRFDEEDITISVTLAAPTPISPTTTTNDPTPLFQWTASPTATSYNLVVENLTDGGTVIDQSGIMATNFTPTTPLVSGKLYRWQVRSSDGINVSPFSTQITFEVDSVAPSVVGDLSGQSPVEAMHTGLTIFDSSGFQTGFGPEITVDGDVNSIYATPGRTSVQEEFITYDLGMSKSVGRVRLHSRESFGSLMPRDFVIEVSNNPSTGFTDATTVINFSAPDSPAQWYTFNFTPVTGRYVRLRVTKTNQFSNGLYYVSFNEFEAWQTAPLGSVLLSWTAPSDDFSIPNVGTVASYDIRYSTVTPFNYVGATPVGLFPIPVAAPGVQTFLVTGLTAETVYNFALTATDDAGNVSGVSNVTVVSSKGFPPDAIVDLAPSNRMLTTIDLSWTAPQDPPSGGAADSYDIRYSTSMIDADNFTSALPVQGTVPGPAAPTQLQMMTVTGLSPNTTYYFAMKSIDGGLNASDLSNVVMFATTDNVPPDPITTLQVQYFDDDTVDLIWNATGDDGMTGTGTSFDLRYNTVDITDDMVFGMSMQATGEPAPGAPGTLHRFTVGMLTPGTMYYFTVKQVDEQNNASLLSTVASVTTHADLPEPLITPASGATLTSSIQTFQWAANGLAATQWQLYVGTTQGANDIADSGNVGPALAHTVTGLPTDGSILWVRLWYFAGFWGYSDFQFTAHTPPPPPPPPAITVPTPSSTLSGASEVFQWIDNGAAVMEWWVNVGSSVGGSNYFDSGSLGVATQVNVTGLPTDGSIVHVRLWYRVDGLWDSQDFQYTASTGPGPGNPEITSPVPSSTLGSAAELFDWTANGAAVTEWWLYVGSSSAGSDIFDSGSLGATTQVLVTGLPTDGSQVFARLWYRIGGLWQFIDAQYTATNIMGGGTPSITSPTPSSTLAAASQLFQWSENGSGATEWWLYAGSMVGGSQFFDSGTLGAATAQFNMTGLPVNGSTIHVRLWYRVAGIWQFIDEQYTAANLTPTITTPAPSSVLAGASVPFQWITNGVPVTEWWVYAGSTAGQADYFDSGSLGGATLMTTVTSLPTDGTTVHVTLWYRVGGLWQSAAFQYTAFGP